MVKMDRVVRAPPGREVEDCTPLELAEILREVAPISIPDVVSTEQLSDRKHTHRRDRQEYPIAVQREANQAQTVPAGNDIDNQDNQQIVSVVRDVFPQINETLEAVVLDGSMKILLKVPVSDLLKRLNSTEGAKVLVLDGIVTQRLVEAANKAGIEYIVGHRTTDFKKPLDIKIRTFGDIGTGN
jgi:hypothetical protein